jgi:hypothetical protein
MDLVRVILLLTAGTIVLFWIFASRSEVLIQ